MLHLCAVIYFSVKNILVQCTNLKTDWKEEHVRSRHLSRRERNACYNATQFSRGQMRYDTCAQENKFCLFSHDFQSTLKGLKNILLDNWHLIQNQPNFREIFKESLLISYTKGKSLKDMLVKAKLCRQTNTTVIQQE